MQLQVVFLLLGTLVCCGRGQTEIHIAFITSFDGDYDSSVTVPAVQLATDQVNADPSIIPGHKLIVELIDNITIARSFANSQCNKYEAQSTFLRQIISGQNKVALIGCGCSLATEPVAEISRLWNITHISYTPSSDYLSNRQLFPSLWRTYPPEANISSPIIAILKRYNWTKMKILTQEEDLFLTSGEALINDLSASEVNMTEINVTTFSTQTNVFNLTESELFPEEIRVYFLNMYPVHARRIMCRAAHNQKTNPNPEHHYPGYIWITFGWYQENWWRESGADSSSLPCSDEDLEPFLRNTFSIQLGNNSMDRTAATDVKLTTAEFERRIAEMRDYESSSFSVAAYLAYDAIWTLVMGIDRALPTIETDLMNFSYETNGRRVRDSITAHLSKPDFRFTGVSGEVRYDANGTRVPAPAKIFKYRDSNDSAAAAVQREQIATDNGSTLAYIEGENDTTTWPGGRVPSDGTPEVILNTYYAPIYIIYDIAVVIGIGFAIVCLLFNFIFRNRKIVRLISPNLNYFIILGAILLYISVAFFVFPTLDPFSVTFACHFRAWAQTLGYFLCFGTVVAKMWRVYFIFHHPQVQVTKARQRAIKDWHLMLIVITLCIIVVIFFTGVAIFGDYKAAEVQDVERPDSRNEDNVLHDSHNLVCQGPRDLYWIIALYAYILITQFISVFLAFKTRKVKIKALNDARYITVIIYATTIIIVVMIVCAVLLSDHLNADGAVFGGLLYIFATIVLSVLFIPKMVILYKDPKGEKIFERTHSVSQMTATNCNFDDLERHCKQLESRLGKYETVAPYNRSNSQSSIRKFSASTGFLASLPMTASGPTPSSPIYNINPTLSLPATPLKVPNDDGKMTDGTSGYLSDSPPSDKGKQILSLDLGNEDKNKVEVDVEQGVVQPEP